MKIPSLKRFLTILAFALAPPSLLAQSENEAAPPTANPQPLQDQVVALDAFNVSAARDTGYLSKYTLSGTRTSENIMDLGQTVNIANAQLISDLGATMMTEAAYYASAGLIRRSFNPGDDQYIWGFRSSGSMRDGYIFGSNAVGSLYDVDHIEVVKGPGAMIYGQAAAVGGIVNYITRQPSRVPHADLELTYGSYDDRRGELHLSGPIVPKLLYRLDAGSTDSRWGPRTFSFYQDQFVGGEFEYDVSSTTKMTVDASYFSLNYNYPKTALDPFTGKVLPSPTFDTEEAYADSPSSLWRGSFILTSAMTPVFQVRTFFGYDQYLNNWHDMNPGGWSPGFTSITRSWEYYHRSDHTDTFQEDFSYDLLSSWATHRITAGFEQVSETEYSYDPVWSVPAISVVNPVHGALPDPSSFSNDTGSKSQNRRPSAYLQDEVKLWDNRIGLIGGARYADYNAYSSAGGNPNPGLVTNFYGSQTTARYGATLHPTPDTTVYASHMESFIFNSGTLVPSGAAEIPSIGKDNELGAKAELLDHSVFLTATYFDLSLTNVLVDTVQGPGDPHPGNPATSQGGQQNNKGLDLSGLWAKKFEDGEFDGTATLYRGNIKDQTGNKPIGAVNNSWSLLASYRFKRGALNGFALGAGVRWMGDRVGPKLTGSGVMSILPNYSTSNAFVSDRFGRFKLQVNVDNLSDNRFIEGYETATWIFTNPGRTIHVTVGYSF